MVAKTRFLGLFLICIVCVACGPTGPEMGQVNGIVTFDDKPISGTVQFWPDNGRPARGSIDEDGSFTLTTFESDDGALVGSHRVTIKATQLSESGPEIGSTQAEIAHFSQKGAKRVRASRVKWLVPEEYSEADTTPLTATVQTGTNTIDFRIEKE